jgi:hypothetical protein
MEGWRAGLAGATLAATLAGCTTRDPEGELSGLIDAAESAAEARDTGFFRELLSTSYVDTHGRRREDVIDLIRGFFLVHGTLEVVTRIDEIALDGEDAAAMVLQTAVVGRPQGQSALEIDADFVRLELELVREEDAWRVIGAEWQHP